MAISTYDQKMYIIENAKYLNIKTKIEIGSLVKNEFGNSKPPFVETGNNKKEVNINLDTIEESNPSILNHIYNKVKARVNLLSSTI